MFARGGGVCKNLFSALPASGRSSCGSTGQVMSNFLLGEEGEESEQAQKFGFGSYNLPGWSQLYYSGLAGLVPLSDSMRQANDLGHPLANNRRTGDVCLGISCQSGTAWMTTWFSSAKDSQLDVSIYLHWICFCPEVFHPHLCCIKCTSACPITSPLTTCLPPFTNLVARLPHFFTGYMRSWDRSITAGDWQGLRHCLIPNLLDR